LRGLSEIATNPPLLLLAAMAAGSGGGSRNQVRTPTGFPARLSSPIKADPPINLTHRATVTAKLARRSSGKATFICFMSSPEILRARQLASDYGEHAAFQAAHLKDKTEHAVLSKELTQFRRELGD